MARHVGSGPRRSRGRRDEGASTIELVFYAPVLMLVVFVTVQAGMIYLGNQAATTIARESARVARTSGAETSAQRQVAEATGEGYAARVAAGILTGVDVQVQLLPGGETVRATVVADSYALVPALGGRVTRSVEGPVEEFRPDDR